jgi:hypothetical protein
MDRRRKLLVNVGEEKVSNLLSQAVTSHLASVCPKVGLKDAVNISNSGLPDELYRYALMAHLDFVVVDRLGKVAFAVEFDEQHHESNLTAIQNDKKKDLICEKLGLPLIRVAHDSLYHVEKMDILGWLTDRYFYHKSIPKEFIESAEFFSHLNKMGVFRETQNDWPSTVVHNFSNLRMQAWTFVQFRDHAFFYASAAFRCFPEFTKILPHQIATEISQVILYRMIKPLVESGRLHSEQTLDMLCEEVAKQYFLANNAIPDTSTQTKNR